MTIPNPIDETDNSRTSAEGLFIRNDYGLWCPNCQESIDEMWPVSCDHCGYPSPDCEDYSRDPLDDLDDHDFDAFLGDR